MQLVIGRVTLPRRCHAPRAQSHESLGRTKSPRMSNQRWSSQNYIGSLDRCLQRLAAKNRFSSVRSLTKKWQGSMGILISNATTYRRLKSLGFQRRYHQQSLCLTWNRKRSVWNGLGGIPNGARKISNMSSFQIKANLSSDSEIRAQEFGAKSGRETERTVWRDVSNILYP